MKLAVPDMISNSYFPAIAAIELGCFKQEGLDVELELIFPVDKSYAALRDGVLALLDALPVALHQELGAQVAGLHLRLLLQGRGGGVGCDLLVDALDRSPCGQQGRAFPVAGPRQARSRQDQPRDPPRYGERERSPRQTAHFPIPPKTRKASHRASGSVNAWCVGNRSLRIE